MVNLVPALLGVINRVPGCRRMQRCVPADPRWRIATISTLNESGVPVTGTGRPS